MREIHESDVILLAVTKVGYSELSVILEEGEETTISVTFDKILEKPISVNYTLTAISEFGECEVLISAYKLKPL